MKTKISEKGTTPKRKNRLSLNGLLLVLLTIGFSVNLSAQNESVLKFNLKFGILKGGEAFVTISDTVYNGTKAIYYCIEGKTTGLTNTLYSVHDTYRSIVDASTHLPLWADRSIKEKKYRNYNEVFFYRGNDSIYSERTGGLKVDPNLMDIASVFFYIVQPKYFSNIEQGQPVELKVLNGDEIMNMKIRIDGEEMVETELGDVLCYKLIPEMKKGKVLKSNDALCLYIAKETRFPVLIDMDMRMGSLRGVLSRYTVNGVKQKAF